MSGGARRAQDIRRHLVDLEADAYEGATDRAGREATFQRAVELIGPVVEGVLGEFSDLFLGGTGTVAFAEPDSDGLESVWSMSWPAQQQATRRSGVPGPPEVGPIKVRAIFPPGWTHGHLGGEHVGHWPLQVTTPADAERQRDVIWAIAEAELHEWIFSSASPWQSLQPIDEVAAAGRTLKARLQARHVVQGIFCRSAATLETIQAAQLAGLDFLIVDGEHGNGSTDAQLAAFCEVGRLRGVDVLVRLPAPIPHLASRALDLGATGVVVPRCRTPEEVSGVLDGCFLPPLGIRGFSPRTRAAAFAAQELGSSRLDEVVSALNRSTVVIIQVETPELIAVLDAVLADPRIDGLLLGTHDLAVAMGQPEKDVSAEAVKRVSSAAGDRPVSWGRVVRANEKQATKAAGGSLLVLGTDAALLADAMRAAVQSGGGE